MHPANIPCNNTYDGRHSAYGHPKSWNRRCSTFCDGVSTRPGPPTTAPPAAATPTSGFEPTPPPLLAPATADDDEPPRALPPPTLPPPPSTGCDPETAPTAAVAASVPCPAVPGRATPQPAHLSSAAGFATAHSGHSHGLVVVAAGLVGGLVPVAFFGALVFAAVAAFLLFFF